MGITELSFMYTTSYNIIIYPMTVGFTLNVQLMTKHLSKVKRVMVLHNNGIMVLSSFMLALSGFYHREKNI